MSGDLNFVIFNVRDIAAARAFYTETLGFTITSDLPNFLQFQAPSGATFAIRENEAATPTTTIELWWQVEDADATYAALAQHSAPLLGEPKNQPFGRTFAVKDPAGNIVSFYQPHQ